MDGKALAAGVARFRAAELGDFAERGLAVRQIAEQIEGLVVRRLPDEPSWVEAGTSTDGLVITLITETAPELAFEGALWFYSGATTAGDSLSQVPSP